MGCLAVIANLPKTVVIALIERLYRRFGFEGIKMTMSTMAGPELAENQSGESELMPFEVLGGTFRATRWITPDSTLLTSLTVGRVYAAVGSAAHPEGELRGQMLRVGVPR